MDNYKPKNPKKLMKRDSEVHLFGLVNDRINLLEDMIKHSGPNIMCWIVDSKKISDLRSKIFELDVVVKTPEAYNKVPILKDKLNKIEKRLKECYAYS